MTKEFENFKNILGQKQNELEIQARTTQKVQNDETARKQAEDRQKQRESDQRAAENKKNFENAGVVKLLEEIKNSGLVKYEYKPIYTKKYVPMNHYKDTFWGKKLIGNWDVLADVKISEFETVKIVWGEENKSIEFRFNINSPDYLYDYFKLDLLSNKKIGVIESIKDPNDEGYRVGTTARSSYWHYNYIDRETEIINLQEYIAGKLLKPDHYDNIPNYPEP